MTIGLTVLATALAVAVLFGVLRRVRDGRLRPERADRRADRSALAPAGGKAGGTGGGTAASPAAVAVDGALGERATLVQFSSAFCAPCRATRQLLTLVAEQTPGVRHVEVDAESHLGLVRALGIIRTPTTVLLDGASRETGRVVGVPRRDDLDAALGRSVSA